MSRMGDFYITVAEQAGLDICEEQTMERVAKAHELVPADTKNPIDALDIMVDALLDGQA